MKKIFLLCSLIFLFGCTGMSDSVLSPEQQKDLKSEWEQKSPEEKQQLKAYYYEFKRLPKSEREDLKDKWEHLSAERKEYLINRAKRLTSAEREKEAKKFFKMPNRERLDYLDTVK
jgi:hypothetical protein